MATTPTEVRVAVLWSRLSGYIANCLRALSRAGADLLVVHWPPSPVAPFAVERLGLPGKRYARTEVAGIADLRAMLERFAPHAILVSGWMDWGYLRVARRLRRRGCLVIGAMDNQWFRSARQRLGTLLAGWYLRGSFDALWVPGDRSAQFARRLGFRGRHLWYGLYAGLDASLQQVAERRFATYEQTGVWPRRFVFVGRYEPVKGLPELIEAYQLYSARARDSSWQLFCAGHGSLKNLLRGVPGVHDVGFVQPDELGGLLEQAGAFVLPSRREGWVVALAEACAAGLPVICSDACGSQVELVRDWYNGVVIPAGDPEALAQAMLTLSSLPVEELTLWGRRSARFAECYTAEHWARYFLGKLAQMGELGSVRHGPL